MRFERGESFAGQWRLESKSNISKLANEGSFNSDGIINSSGIVEFKDVEGLDGSSKGMAWWGSPMVESTPRGRRVKKEACY